MARRKVYVDGVPFTEVSLTGDEPPVRLYDTSGPGSDPRSGLPPLRRPWILARGDVEEYDGRSPTLRDDGRAAVRRGEAADAWPGDGHGGPAVRPLRARPGR